MKFSFENARGAGPASASDALVVAILENGVLTEAAKHLDGQTGGAVSRALKASRNPGKAGQLLEILAPSGTKASRILLAGIGKPETFDSNAAEKLGASVVARLAISGVTKVRFSLDLPKPAKLSNAVLAAHTALGSHLRAYRFDLHRKVNKDEVPSLVEAVLITAADAEARKVWGPLLAVGEGISIARDLTNEPANILYPDEFARRTKSLLTKLGVSVEILGVPQMKRLGMNTLLAVGQGSAHESRLVVMRWNGVPKSKAGPKPAPLAFIGKGVCFDSGGLSLKPAASMMGMKGDMAGAAAVVGLMHAVARRKARADVIGVIGLVENMPDGKALHPNDIITSLSGQTVEVLNTDAEGRLVLADALWYCQEKYKPKFMINLATLTGAILVALGAEHAGLFSNDDSLCERLSSAGKAEGEPVWRLPLGDAYDKLLKSKIADMKNIGGSSAGSITAAQFLQRFVNKVPWAHLDIAGVAWQDGEQKPLVPSWGTGWGVRLLNRLVADHYEQ